MSAPQVLLAQDAIHHLDVWMSGHGQSRNQEQMRLALQQAYEEIGTVYDWSFLRTQGRVFLKAAYSTGTVAYDHSGNVSGYERYVTLTTGTWASDADWIEDATIRIGDIPCRVEQYIDATHLTLDAVLNPGEDVAAGATYSVYPHYYALPNDFVRMAQPWTESLWYGASEVSYEELMTFDRYYPDEGEPKYFCIRGVEDLYGQMGLYLWPPSNEDATLDFVYHRRPREIQWTGYNAADYQGTVTVAASSATITGNTTAFDSDMVGAVLRLSRSSTKPTGRWGANPYCAQQTIETVSSATSITLASTITTARSAVSYCISDPIDLDYALSNVYLACAVMHLAKQLGGRVADEAQAEYKRALFQAQSVDNSRSEQRRVMGQTKGRLRRFKDTFTDTYTDYD